MSHPDFSKYLMTGKEYARLRHPFRQSFDFHLRAGARELYYFGFRHSNDPANPMFARLLKKMSKFQPNLVLVEGVQGINSLSKKRLGELAEINAPKDRIIKKYGEPGFAFQWAVQNGVAARSPEPHDKELARWVLAQRFSRDQYFAYWACNVLWQWHRMQIKPGHSVYLRRFCVSWEKYWGWKGYDFSMAHFRGIYKEIYGRAFEITDEQAIKGACDPIPWGPGHSYGVLNQVAAATTRARDSYMLEQIYHYFMREQKQRIFIVFGSSHAVMQEPALRKMFGYFREPL